MKYAKPIPLEKRKDVFYVRCQPKVKKLLLQNMHQDGFTCMSDWFEQFVFSVFDEKKPNTRGKKKRKVS